MSEIISTIVVVIGPHMTAGSSLISLAKNGNEQPTNLEITIVINKVIATSPAIIDLEIFISKVGNLANKESVFTMPTDISNISQPNEKIETIAPITAATLNSFQITFP